MVDYIPELISNAMTIAALLIAACLMIMKRRSMQANLPGIKPFYAIPTPSGGGGLLGHLLLLNGNKLHLVLTRWANELGGLFRVRVITEHMLVITDPKLFVPLLGSGDDALPKTPLYLDFDQIHSSKEASMFSMPDHTSPKFKIIRKELALAFSMKTMKESMHSLMSTGRALAACWGAGGSIEVLHDIDIAILDHLLVSSFKLKFSEDQKIDFMKSLSPALAEMSLRLANPLRSKLQRFTPFLPSSKRVKKVMQGSHNMWSMVYDRIKANSPYDATDLSFAACLWRLESDHGLPPGAVVSNISLMMIAGYETSSGAIAWALYDIASNPAVQTKLHAELQSAGLIQSASSRPVTWEDLSLPYLNAIVKESARVHPVAASGTHRVANKDTCIGGYQVPKGTMITIQPGAIHNSIHNWDDPMAFKPERWLEGGKGAENPAYLPFSLGPRNCLGQNMAYVTVRVILLELLSKLKLAVDPRMGSKEDVYANQVLELTMKHNGGIHLIAERL